MYILCIIYIYIYEHMASLDLLGADFPKLSRKGKSIQQGRVACIQRFATFQAQCLCESRLCEALLAGEGESLLEDHPQKAGRIS